MNIEPPYHDTINKLLYAILQHFEVNPVSVNIPLPPYYNVTNRLLYEILQKLNTPKIPEVVYLQFRVLYVSARYGDDSTAEANNINKPYKTISAAIMNVLYGDMIYVLPGTYDEGYLFGNYRMWFDLGAEVQYSGTGAIFHQMYGECTVRGYGVFKCTGTASVVDVGNWINCVLDMECESIEANNSAIVLWQNRHQLNPENYKPHRVKAKRAYSKFGVGVHLSFNSHAEVEIDDIISDSSTEYSLYGTNPRKGLVKNSTITGNNFGTVYMDAVSLVEITNCKVICNLDNSLGHGMWFQGIFDSITINNTSIWCKNIEAKSIYAGTTFALYLDNNVTANRDVGGVAPIIYKSNKLILENIEAIVNITGSTTLDLLKCQNATVIKLMSSNLSETINLITNAPRHHSFKLLPMGNLSLQIESTDPFAANDTSIVLESPTLLLDGKTGDWIELQNGRYGTGNKQITASIYINYESAG